MNLNYKPNYAQPGPNPGQYAAQNPGNYVAAVERKYPRADSSRRLFDVAVPKSGSPKDQFLAVWWSLKRAVTNTLNSPPYRGADGKEATSTDKSYARQIKQRMDRFEGRDGVDSTRTDDSFWTDLYQRVGNAIADTPYNNPTISPQEHGEWFDRWLAPERKDFTPQPVQYNNYNNWTPANNYNNGYNQNNWNPMPAGPALLAAVPTDKKSFIDAWNNLKLGAMNAKLRGIDRTEKDIGDQLDNRLNQFASQVEGKKPVNDWAALGQSFKQAVDQLPYNGDKTKVAAVIQKYCPGPKPTPQPDDRKPYPPPSPDREDPSKFTFLYDQVSKIAQSGDQNTERTAVARILYNRMDPVYQELAKLPPGAPISSQIRDRMNAAVDVQSIVAQNKGLTVDKVNGYISDFLRDYNPPAPQPIPPGPAPQPIPPTPSDCDAFVSALGFPGAKAMSVDNTCTVFTTRDLGNVIFIPFQSKVTTPLITGATFGYQANKGDDGKTKYLNLADFPVFQEEQHDIVRLAALKDIKLSGACNAATGLRPFIMRVLLFSDSQTPTEFAANVKSVLDAVPHPMTGQSLAKSLKW